MSRKLLQVQKLAVFVRMKHTLRNDNVDKLELEKSKLMRPEKVVNRIDWIYLLNDTASPSVEENIRRRASGGDIVKVRQLWKERHQGNDDPALLSQLIQEALLIPNRTHVKSMECGQVPAIIYTNKSDSSQDVQEFTKYSKSQGMLRNENLGVFNGQKSYFLMGPLAELEQALIKYTLDSLTVCGFKFISVPDVLNSNVIEGCGFPTKGERNQVYWLKDGDRETNLCLSGTSEMAIGGFLQNKIFDEKNLPLKFASVSRCFRAETSKIEEEKGIYRVHQFTKVEMFGVTAEESGEESNELQEEFKQIEANLFDRLGLSYQILEMPPNELGAGAHRKIDIEAWMPGRKMFGEISSCSNCLDFQSRRLNVRYRPRRTPNILKYVHTVNGTACAIPRMLISLVETYHNKEVPPVLKLRRPWSEIVSSYSPISYTFLKSKANMDKAAKEFKSL